MKEAILLMGYHEAVQVNKARIKTNYNNWEICLDKVERLGCFVEVEEIAQGYVEVEEIQNKLFNFLKSLGVRQEDKVIQGYDTMIYHNKNSTFVVGLNK